MKDYYSIKEWFNFETDFMTEKLLGYIAYNMSNRNNYNIKPVLQKDGVNYINTYHKEILEEITQLQED